MSQCDERVGNILRTYFGEISSIPFRTYNGASYILECDIEYFANKNGIEDVSIVEEAINVNNPRRFYTIINEESEVYYPITEAINIDAINDAKNYSTLFGYADRLTDQMVAAITGKKYDNVREIDDQIARCRKCLKDIEEEKARIAKNPKDADSYKFTKEAGRFIIGAIVSVFILKKGGIIGKMISTWQAIQGTYELILSVADYERLLNNLEASIETSISKLEVRKVKEMNKQKEAKTKKKEGKKK